MGKGKGKTQDNSWVARIPAAKILFAFRMRKKKLVSYAENKLKTTANLLPIRSSVIRERLLLEQKKMFSKN
jgi:ribosomal protein L16/L10AE